MSTEYAIDLWTWALVPAPTDLARLETLLSDDERERASRLLSIGHRAGYVAARGRLREILATYTDRLPSELKFVYGNAGKPALAEDVVDAPHFNLSHTDQFAALAVTAHAPVGIDIEHVRPLKDNIARRFFTPREVAAIEAHPSEQRTAAFYRCWTRKEAFVKAVGKGLGFRLDAFNVSIEDGAPPAILRIAGEPVEEVARWRLLHIAPAPGIIGAIAVKLANRGDRVVYRQRC